MIQNNSSEDIRNYNGVRSLRKLFTRQSSKFLFLNDCINCISIEMIVGGKGFGRREAIVARLGVFIRWSGVRHVFRVRRNVLLIDSSRI